VKSPCACGTSPTVSAPSSGSGHRAAAFLLGQPRVPADSTGALAAMGLGSRTALSWSRKNIGLWFGEQGSYRVPTVEAGFSCPRGKTRGAELGDAGGVVVGWEWWPESCSCLSWSEAGIGSVTVPMAGTACAFELSRRMLKLWRREKTVSALSFRTRKVRRYKGGKTQRARQVMPELLVKWKLTLRWRKKETTERGKRRL